MKDYIYLIRPTRNNFIETVTNDEKNTVNEHFNYLQNNFNKGIVKFVGRTEQAEFGICVFQAKNDKEADEFTKNDPAVKKQSFYIGILSF